MLYNKNALRDLHDQLHHQDHATYLKIREHYKLEYAKQNKATPFSTFWAIAMKRLKLLHDYKIPAKLETEHQRQLRLQSLREYQQGNPDHLKRTPQVWE
jgi:hypothetical protein